MIVTLTHHQLRSIRRQRTFVMFLGSFVLITTMAALLGYSSSRTIVRVYDEATKLLAETGQPAPPNPFDVTPSLALLSNMTIYVPFIGAILAVVLGHSTVIDDKALAEISGETSYRPAGPFQAPLRQAGPQRIAYAATPQASGVGPQKVLRIVFPAHVDGAGRYHETSVVQAVVDNGQWLAATDGHGPALAATQVLNVSPEILSQLGTPIPPSASAPVEVPATAPVVAVPPASAVGAPTAAAVAAARAKAREAAAGKGVPVAARAATPAPAPVGAKPKSNAPEFASGNPANRPASFSPRVED